MNLRIGLVVLLCCLSGLNVEAKAKAKAKVRAPRHSPRDVVAQYLAADFAGSRVFKDDKAATTQLVTWSEEPPWDQILIVSRYEIQKSKVSRKMAKTAVKYSNLGELKGDVFYADPISEQTRFDAIRRNGSWRVDRPILVPHISVASAEKYLQEQLKSIEAGSDRYKTVEKSLSDIQNLNKN